MPFAADEKGKEVPECRKLYTKSLASDRLNPRQGLGCDGLIPHVRPPTVT